MNRQLVSLFLGFVTIIFFSCSCSSRLHPLSSKDFTIHPKPMEVVGTKIPVSIAIQVPAKWMDKKAEVSIIPVLRYPGGELWGLGQKIQGEEVFANNYVVDYKEGGRVEFTSSFDYEDKRQLESQLYLTFIAKIGEKKIELPDVKMAEGLSAVVSLADLNGVRPIVAQDKFQKVIKERVNADIHFLIQQADIRDKEINKSDIKKIQKKVLEAKQRKDQKVNIEIKSYASPDGKLELNENLSLRRESATKKTIQQRIKGDYTITSTYTAEDWEGFRSYVEASDIADKELILRVLSMYKDPEEREQEIRNISVVYDQLAQDILPRLRRSRIIANVETIGKSDDEIRSLLKNNIKTLSLEELLYAATLQSKNEEKLAVYTKILEMFPKDARAYTNIASIYLEKGDMLKAKELYEKAKSVNNIPEIRFNQALIALQENKLRQAEELIGSSLGFNIERENEVLALLYLKQGKYEKAVETFGKTRSNNAGIALILTHNYKKALEVLSSIEMDNATTDYLKALVYQRMKDEKAALNFLREALRRDPNLAEYLQSDYEFASLRDKEEFKYLLH